MNTQKIQSAYKAVKAIRRHPIRSAILNFLDKKEKVHVGQIYKQLRLVQSECSLHLRLLREAGVVKAVRKGRFIYYSLNYPRIRQLLKFANDLVV